MPGCIAYGVSKMGVHGMTRCLAVELAPHKINVNAVAPGAIMTAMADDFLGAIGNGDMEAGKQELLKSYPIGRLGQPDDIGNAVVYLASDVVETLGQVDILFTNAGVFHMASIEDHSPEIWMQTLNVNLTGQFLTCQRVIPEMKKLGKGKIVNGGSIFGHQGVMGCVAYGVSKMGVHGMTRCLAAELAPHNINVNAVAPGATITAMADEFLVAMGNGNMEAGKQELLKSYPMGRLGQPDDIGNAVVYLASDAADFITGQILFIDGGYTVP